MRILICDDEPAMVKQISEIIADAYPDIELVGVHSSAELSEKLAPEDANRKFDLAFLDIAVSDESGVDIAAGRSRIRWSSRSRTYRGRTAPNIFYSKAGTF